MRTSTTQVNLVEETGNGNTFLSPEFFWFPNHGSEEGFWQNCWNNDGQEEHSKNLNNSLDYEYQVGLVMFQMIPKSIFFPGVFKLLV